MASHALTVGGGGSWAALNAPGGGGGGYAAGFGGGGGGGAAAAAAGGGSSLGDQEDAVADFMAILNEHRRNCEKLGRYVEAEIARKRLDELRGHEESRRREALRARQLGEALAVEEAHMMEFQQFNALQDAKMAAFEMNAQALMDALRERHAAELRDFQARLLAKVGPPRHSREYYTLRDVQGKLASGKNYAGAARLKEKADELMAYEEEKWSNEKQSEMLAKERAFKMKLAAEAEALKKRIAQGRGEVNRARQNELERLLQRYNNVKTETETRHKVERQKLDKEINLEHRTAANGGGSAAGGSAGGGGGGASAGASRLSVGTSGGRSRSTQAAAGAAIVAVHPMGREPPGGAPSSMGSLGPARAGMGTARGGAPGRGGAY
jgi:hypothetical protein